MEKEKKKEKKKDSSIFDSYSELGKGNMKGSKNAFIDRVGEAGIQSIVKDVLTGKNIRDYTEFNTQKRLANSYAALLKLYMDGVGSHAGKTEEYANYVMQDYVAASNGDKRKLDLWLLGLTEKGLDNITRDNIVDYQAAFSDSMDNIVKDLEKSYGPMTGFIEMNGKKMDLNWNVLALMLMATGAQTLTIRGSEKSTNGKLFEKLILGSLLSIMGFRYCKNPPAKINEEEKVFWLSHMDKDEREIDATFAYYGKAINIDIGFIGKGNPEITLDKVSRFGLQKEIGGIKHEMRTIIIVDTVAAGSDLINKAKRLQGHVFQMKNADWTIEFAKALCDIMEMEHELTEKTIEELEVYFKEKLDEMDIIQFIS